MSKFNPWIKQVFISLTLLIVFMLVAWPLSQKLFKSREVNKEIAGLESEIGDLNKKNSDLRQLIDYLESDQFIDEQARENLNFKKAGEEMVVINDLDTEEVLEKQESLYRLASNVEEKKPGNPEKWFKYFFK
jgi:cell division protein FtsB